MACDTISTGGTITLTAGSLGSYCHTSWQNTLNAFVSATTATIGTGALFAAGVSAPATNYLWLKQDEDDGCNPLGWYFHDGSAWVAVSLPAESLPIISGLPTGVQGSSTMNAQVTVDTYGRVTALTEVTPADETTDGHAKAWCQIGDGTDATTITSGLGTAYNIASATRTSIGEIVVKTDEDLFSNVCIAIASHPGFGTAGGTGSGDNFTGADHVRVVSTITGTDQGTATIELPRLQHDGIQGDGDENFDNDKGEATKLNIVFFGN